MGHFLLGEKGEDEFALQGLLDYSCLFSIIHKEKEQKNGNECLEIHLFVYGEPVPAFSLCFGLTLRLSGS